MPNHLPVRWLQLASALLLGVVASVTAWPAHGGVLRPIYLPLVRSDFTTPGLWGVLTDENVPAGGVSLALYQQRDVNDLVLITSTVSAANGLFLFDSVPALPPGNSYIIYYRNTVDSSRFSRLDTRRVFAYAPGDSVHVGDYDLATVALISPTVGPASYPPIWFEWVKRPLSPSDNYLLLFSTVDHFMLVYFTTDAWNNEFYLDTRPSNMFAYERYVWSVVTRFPDGAWGYSFEWREICFVGCPLLAGAAQPPDLHQLFP